ncbi:hypothetical protein Tco_1093932 [Tanacetum coccineum]|uniref:Uncharacterized protein n=1 Tax=Tanacetum coccineum TaxID=301880 RepID=A0ABQ5IFG1_9ASTR
MVEGSGDWNSPEVQDTANSGQLKKTRAMVFHQMDTEEVSDRFVAPCFVNGMEVYDGEINLREEDNMISKEYAVKLCLEHEVKRGNKVVKKELIVALKGEIYFVKFIINSDEDNVEPGVIFGRSYSGKNILVDRDAPIVVGIGFLRTIGGIVNTQERLFLMFDGLCHQTFRAARSEVMRNTESDSDDEEDYQIKRNKFGAPIYGPKPAPYLHYNDLDERLLAIQTEGCSRDVKSRYNTKLAQLLPRHIYSPCIMNLDILNKMGCDGEIDEMLRIRVREAGSDEEIFTSVAWIRAFNINEPIYAELCHEFYSTYEFDEVCADDELQSKKIIKFRLRGRAHNFTLLEFARHLGLYQAAELDEEGFDVYFQGGLRNIKNFNAYEYWVIARWIKKKGAGTQKESQICYGQFISKLARKSRVLADEVLRSLSALTYCKDLDTTTLRDLIDSEDRLIPEDPQPGMPRVGIPRPPRASMQDLYDRMGRMEIRQEAIERMEYRQSYHWDRHAGVFKHMARVYSVPLQGAYDPPGYAQPQYD